MKIDNTEIFKKFIDEITNWSRTDKRINISSRDLIYVFNLQKKRLEKSNLKVIYDFNLRGEHLDKIRTINLNDYGKYYSQITYRQYNKNTTYYINNKKVKKVKDNIIIYLIITNLKGQDLDIKYSCPNCGAISNVKELLNGCPYCKTIFIIEDLFPKVTNFYHIDSYSENKETIKKGILKWIGSIAIISLIYNFINFNGTFMDMVGIIIVSCIIGTVIGYFAWAIFKIFSLLLSSINTMPLLKAKHTALKKLPSLMNQIDQNFSYEYFVGKILALIKIMIFCDDYKNLAIYIGNPIKNTFKNIVDIHYRGTIELNSFNIDGLYCYVDITAYMTVFYLINNHIKEENVNFRITVCKNINAITDSNFELVAVTCKSCGASFDATKNRKCSYCNSIYNLCDDDWVITSFKKV